MVLTFSPGDHKQLQAAGLPGVGTELKNQAESGCFQTLFVYLLGKRNQLPLVGLRNA